MRELLAVAASLTAAILIAVTAAAAPGGLHLKLEKSMPEADQVISSPPTKIVLQFSQKPELAISRIALHAGDVEVELGEVTRDDDDETILWAAVADELDAGAYTVSWLTSSGDGHPIRGEFAFVLEVAR